MQSNTTNISLTLVWNNISEHRAETDHVFALPIPSGTFVGPVIENIYGLPCSVILMTLATSIQTGSVECSLAITNIFRYYLRSDRLITVGYNRLAVMDPRYDLHMFYIRLGIMADLLNPAAPSQAMVLPLHISSIPGITDEFVNAVLTPRGLSHTRHFILIFNIEDVLSSATPVASSISPLSSSSHTSLPAISAPLAQISPSQGSFPHRTNNPSPRVDTHPYSQSLRRAHPVGGLFPSRSMDSIQDSFGRGYSSLSMMSSPASSLEDIVMSSNA